MTGKRYRIFNFIKMPLLHSTGFFVLSLSLSRFFIFFQKVDFKANHPRPILSLLSLITESRFILLRKKTSLNNTVFKNIKNVGSSFSDNGIKKEASKC
tara:strand:- start:561 stop:854 length:294 start_codon:yes stop_codon:yes gene_type:complete